MEFTFFVEDIDELAAMDVVIHNTDGTIEIHRIYDASSPDLTVIDGGDQLQ